MLYPHPLPPPGSSWVPGRVGVVPQQEPARQSEIRQTVPGPFRYPELQEGVPDGFHGVPSRWPLCLCLAPPIVLGE